MQFLKENNLERTLKVMQEETKVSLNCVDNLPELCKNIRHGSLVRLYGIFCARIICIYM